MDSLRRLIALLVLLCLLTALTRSQAQPTIISVQPPDGASGASPTTNVVFTFSEAMNTDTNVTTVEFIDVFNPFTPIPVSYAWSAGDTMLTCTPLPSFP